MKEQDIRKVLADKLRQFRDSAGLTAKEVGDRIGKSAKTVSGWEHGRGQPDADMLFTLCELYGIKSIAEFYPSEASVEASALTADETELLSLYRSLDRAGRTLALSTIRAFAGNPDMQKDTQNVSAM